MARNRLIVSIIVVALLGFTLTPQAYLPCCCKGADKRCAGEPSCPHHPQEVKSCCAPSSTVAPCHAAQAVKANCPICRCLEHYHVVVIAGSNAADTTVRVPLEGALLALADQHPGLVTEQAGLLISESPPGTAILLKSCTLRC